MFSGYFYIHYRILKKLFSSNIKKNWNTSRVSLDQMGARNYIRERFFYISLKLTIFFNVTKRRLGKK